MATRQLDYQCWVLEYPAGAPEDHRHFPSAAEAEGTVSGDYVGHVTVWRLSAPCHVVVCDDPGCGEELENLDDGWTIHLGSPAEARTMAAVHGWTVAADGTLACWDEPAAAEVTT